LPYAVGGAPPIGFDSGTRTGAGAGAQARAPVPDSAALVAATAARRRKRRQRREEASMRGHADAFADLETDDVGPDIPPETVGSDAGAGTLGFAGTVSDGSVQAAGLTVLAGDEFGGGPRTPLIPRTWQPDGEQP
jgi:hypothetical protein